MQPMFDHKGRFDVSFMIVKYDLFPKFVIALIYVLLCLLYIVAVVT